jgi:hypothetical protein
MAGGEQPISTGALFCLDLAGGTLANLLYKTS